MKEFAFDIKLWAVVRVQATSEAKARGKLHTVVDCIHIGLDVDGVKLTEATCNRGDEVDLIEINGETV